MASPSGLPPFARPKVKMPFLFSEFKKRSPPVTTPGLRFGMEVAFPENWKI